MYRNMKEHIILEKIKDKQDLIAVRVKTSTNRFNEKFQGNMSYFFRALKNGLYTLNGISNRVYFQGISGIYYSLLKGEELDIIFLIEPGQNQQLNKLQISTRIKKLLGIDTEVIVGKYGDFESELDKITSIKQKTQVFGDYYFPAKN
jgi:hypothetical protein